MDINPRLQAFVDEFKVVAPAIVDSYIIVDRECRIVDFNQRFYAMLPRSVGRKLRGKKCFDVIKMNLSGYECSAQQCWAEQRHVRLDEIAGEVAGDSAGTFRFILSAIPIADDQGDFVGALEIQRDVTDEATIQVKYQEMLEAEEHRREELTELVRRCRRELLETNQVLHGTQKQLLDLRKGLA